MKDLINFYDKKTIYEEIYGSEYSKNVRRDVERTNKKIKK